MLGLYGCYFPCSLRLFFFISKVGYFDFIFAHLFSYHIFSNPFIWISRLRCHGVVGFARVNLIFIDDVINVFIKRFIVSVVDSQYWRGCLGIQGVK